MKAVYLEWVDSYQPESGAWVCEHKLDISAYKEAMRCRTVGFVVLEDDEVVVLTHSGGGDDSDTLVATPIVIPKIAITLRRDLETSATVDARLSKLDLDDEADYDD